MLWVLAAVFALLLPFHRQARWHATLNLPIGQTAFSDILVFHEFEWLAQRTHPADPFFNQSALCLYLSLDNRTALEFINDDDFTRPEWVEAAVQSLRRDPPHFIVLQPESTDHSDAHNHTAPIRRYVNDNYRLVQIFYLNGSSQYQEELWELKTNSNNP